MGVCDIIKIPLCENDSAFISIDSVYINILKDKIYKDEYYIIKDRKFTDKDVSSDGFEQFTDRLSLRSLPDFLEGTIYTYTCDKKNGKSYASIMRSVIKMLENGSRRALVTIADRFIDYENSEMNSDMDVSCLSSIHYMIGKVTLFFRASDIENELLIDLVTIYDHFVKPVYKESNVVVDVMISTCQNINNFKKIIE